MQRKRRDSRPVPIVDPSLCDGCGLCVRVCPTGALAMSQGAAAVAWPEACDYHGLCEMACPTQAIQRPFEIIDAGT
jgi:thioredoxin reductase (NADPH)